MKRAKRSNAISFAGFVIAMVLIHSLGVAQNFQEQPITEGLRELTAYTLNGGGLRIGDLSLPFDISQLRWLAIDYGLTRDLQLGTALLANFTGTLNLLAKYRILHLSSDLDFSIPLSLALIVGEGRELVFASGLLFSGLLDADFGYHGGLWFSVSNVGGPRISTFYALVDITIDPNAKLLFELDLYPGLEDPLQISMGELQRFGFLNLKVTATWVFPSRVNFLEADIFFRF